MQALNARERYIVAERKLKDEPRTLESWARSWAFRRSGCASWKRLPSKMRRQP
jgi:hypothetical protein